MGKCVKLSHSVNRENSQMLEFVENLSAYDGLGTEVMVNAVSEFISNSSDYLFGYSNALDERLDAFDLEMTKIEEKILFLEFLFDKDVNQKIKSSEIENLEKIKKFEAKMKEQESNSEPRSEVKPQVGDAETNVGVSQSDAGRIFDDVDSVNDDVTGDKTNGKSTTKTEYEPEVLLEVGPKVESDIDEEVEKYVKMLRIGIPVGAVENKMKLDNVDPIKLQPYL